MGPSVEKYLSTVRRPSVQPDSWKFKHDEVDYLATLGSRLSEPRLSVFGLLDVG